MKDSQKAAYEKRIRELELENAKLKGENEILRAWKEIPQRTIIRPQPDTFPFSPPPLKRHPDVTPNKFRWQKAKPRITCFSLPNLKQQTSTPYRGIEPSLALHPQR